jgi:hypothetical protein
MKFSNNVQKLVDLLDTMPAVKIFRHDHCISHGSNDEQSAGVFQIEFFIIEPNETGWAALEQISRAVAVCEASAFRFHLSFRNYDGVCPVFILGWQDRTGNDLYIYDRELEKLHEVLSGIIKLDEEYTREHADSH